MQTANAYRNDDTPDAPATDRIDPEALRAARERRGLTQSQLAEAIGCGKDTVSRWERGYSRRIQPRHRETLCAALGVDWAALAEESEPDDIPGFVRIDAPVAMRVRTAFELVAERYDIDVDEVLATAPLLFLVVAERSLAARRRRLEVARAAVDGAARELAEASPHLEGAAGALAAAFEEAYRAEEESLSENDIYGRRARPGGNRRDDEGPFVRFVRELATDLPEGAVDRLDSFRGDSIDFYRIAEDTLLERTGLSPGGPVGYRALSHIEAGGIDFSECLRIKREQDEAGYLEWLSNAAARAEEEQEKRFARISAGE